MQPQGVLRAALAAVATWAVAGQDAANPITKVVNLLQEMKTQVEKEADDDKDAFDKYECWCTTNRGLKTEAVATAEKRIEELASFLEEAAGNQAKLKTEIEALEQAIVEDQDALKTATALKMQETEEFHASEKDAKEVVEALRQALDVLAKVQLIQKRRGHAAEEEVKPLMLQVRATMEGVNGKLSAFKGVMQRDLWDMMSSIGGGSAADAFLAPPRAGRRMSAIEQAPMTGAAAGAKSYSARSGSIYGMLSEMRDESEKNLAADQRAELEAMIAYQKLRSAKLGEIEAAQTAHDDKQAALADSEAKAAQAKEDLEATKEALSADQKFLVGLEQNCKENVDGYEERAKVRSEELIALAETIKILTEDDARDLFVKRFSFFQMASVSGSSTDAARNKAVDQAMKQILKVARKHHNWVLASLAVRVRLDPFTKVKEAMDKMTADLKEQQKAEFQKKDYCNQEIDEHEDSIKSKSQEKEDLEGKKLGLENQIASLSMDVETLKAEVADMQVALKRAGEDRKAENLVFQQSVSDQRATQSVLEKAKARLAKFYASKNATLAQVGQEPEGAAVPGAAVEAPPPKSKAYEKSAGAGGVIQLLDKVLQDAAAEESELIKTERAAQLSYESMVKDLNSGLKADEKAIVDKTKLLEEATAEKSEHEGALLVNAEEMQKLGDMLTATHLDCDWLLKYFDVRQKARQEELDAIAEAKAILSGADFGKAE